ncbi:MAG: hypothetical protein ACYCX9_06220 [Candidatus Dormibacteria bacterium]|jgi:hypothetical protein
MSDPGQTTASEAQRHSTFPPDIELDEAARNWVRHHPEKARPIRQMAADAAVTSAIGRAYGQG